MTRDSSRRPSFASINSHTTTVANMQLLDILWNAVDFPRLPRDAPPELLDHIIHLEDPRQVYKVHRANRRHNFQLLVEKLIHQLQHGCGSPLCSTTTCMTCRQKVYGTAPIRRYNPTSARTLAVYMASQDNCDRLLCPFIFQENCRSESVESISVSQSPWYKNRRASVKVKAGSVPQPLQSTKRDAAQTPPPRRSSPVKSSESKRSSDKASGHLIISDKEEIKDYRSLSANVFGTVAFRMLEWLTPNSLTTIAYKVSTAEQDDITLQEAAAVPLPDSPISSRSQSPVGRRKSHELVGPQASYNGPLDTISTPSRQSRGHAAASLSRRNSNARVKQPPSSSGKPLRLSQESYPVTDDISNSILSSTTKLGAPKPSRTSSISTGRTITHDEPEYVLPPPATQYLVPRIVDTATTSGSTSVSATPPLFSENEDMSSSGSSQDSGSRNHSKENVVRVVRNQSEVDSYAPQSLNRLSLTLIEFMYRTMKDDGTVEKEHKFRPARLSRTPPVSLIRLMRPGRSKQNRDYPSKLKKDWEGFLVQSIYYCLMNPLALVRSFSDDEKLLPSRSLWWGIAKLLDCQPTVVLHSLWLASSSLFSVPKSLQSLKSPTTTVFRTSDVSMTNEEAGKVMSICLHALVALIPEVADRSVLYDVSRLRSMGLSVTTKTKSTTETYLQCDDAYSDDLALRLARRLFSALIARKHYAEIVAMTSDSEDVDPYMDVLKPLWDQLDQLNVDLKSIHRERMVTVLLDWARVVILNDWNGSPAYPSNTAFAGAFELMDQMYRRRKELFISDFNLRVDYLADRLDPVTFPVSWLSFPKSNKREHLLSHPYIFSNATLITYFRAMNFERMNRQHELANSTYETTRLPINNTPIPNTILNDFVHLHMGAQLTKYLVLKVRRDNIVEDTFNQLWGRREFEYLKPLKVHLGEDEGEGGTDLGGVQQELFRILAAVCFDPAYGAFGIDPRTHMAWFLPGSLVEDWKYEMIGLLFSLAVYNGVTLPVTFPTALYRRLLGQPVTDIQHIEDGWPDLANGLTTLLEWDEKDGAVEDIFARTYEFSVDMFGQPVSREMTAEKSFWPRWGTTVPGKKGLTEDNPEDAPMVTSENRNAYVNDYIRYLTDVSVSSQFKAFQKGFNTCLYPRSFSILTPPMLQSLVEGVQDIDISEIKRFARYVGYDSSEPTIRNFWSVVKRFDDKLKRKLLEFVTASERMPVGGAKNLQFVIQKNGVETGEYPRLPTAYTCYGTILLPEYPSKEVLRERLCLALENTEGFGFA